MKAVQSAGIVVYYQENKHIEYLVLQYAAGHWDFAKGHIEKGETKEEAAKRELMEETGLKAEVFSGFEDSFSYFYKGYDNGKPIKKTVYFFVGKTKSKNVTLSHEHLDFEWLPYKEALKKLTYQNAKILLKKADAFITEK